MSIKIFLSFICCPKTKHQSKSEIQFDRKIDFEELRNSYPV